MVLITAHWGPAPLNRGRGLAWEEEGCGPRAQRGPVAGAAPRFCRTPSIGVSGFVPVWARSIFSSSSCAVVRAWCLEFGGAAAGGGAMRARAVRAARRAACSRVVLPCGCGCCCGGVCAATLAMSGVRAVESARGKREKGFSYFILDKTYFIM